MGTPSGGSHLHLPGSSLRNIFTRNRSLTTEVINISRTRMRTESLHQFGAKQGGRGERYDWKQQPLQPRRSAYTKAGNDADENSRAAEEHEEKATGGRQLSK